MGGRIIDNRQIDNLQIDNRQNYNQSLQFDHLQKLLFHNNKSITYKLMAYK